jgi:hypothetical protein
VGWSRRFTLEFLKDLPRLSCIFFVGRSRTITWSLPIPAVVISGSVALFLMIWAIFSSGFLMFAGERLWSLRDEVATARAQVFEYQALYEGVFEAAYPEKPAALPAEKVLADSVRAADAAMKAMPEPVPSLLAASQPLPLVQRQEATPDKAEELPEAEPSGEAAVIEVGIGEPKLLWSGRDFQASFLLTAPPRTHLVRGFVWAIGEFKDEASVIHKILAPVGTHLDPQTGLVTNYTHGERFAYRRSRKTKVKMAAPQGLAGVFVALEIHVYAGNGRVLAKQTFPLPNSGPIGIRDKVEDSSSQESSTTL